MAVEGDGAGDVRRGRKEAEEGEGGGGLAGAGFADEAEGFAGIDFEGDAVDGGMGVEGDGEVVDFQERVGHGEMVMQGVELRWWLGGLWGWGASKIVMNDMKKILTGLIVVVVACSGAWGQTHKVSKPENVVRAVGVYEWTGDLAKPRASRLIPVTLFIDGELEDAGVYMARPVPFALETGNVYELQDSGVAKGFLELAYARHIPSIDATGD